MFPLAKAGFIDLGPLDLEEGMPYAWTEDQLQTARDYISDLILVAFHGVGEDPKQ